jgi:ATP adenylyltransferase
MKISNDNICCLCSQIRGDAQNDLISKLLTESQYIKRILLESSNFAVIPSLGAITAGHVLLCPHDHIKSFASLQANFHTECLHKKHQLKVVMDNIYHQPVHIFEHGSPSDNNKVLCTVDHAHLHFLPANISIIDKLEQSLDIVEIDQDVISISEIVGKKEYLYYEEPGGKKFLAANIEGYESQLMRKIFMEALGNSMNWNWREAPNPQLADDIYYSFRTHLTSTSA